MCRTASLEEHDPVDIKCLSALCSRTRPSRKGMGVLGHQQQSSQFVVVHLWQAVLCAGDSRECAGQILP